MRFSVVLTAVLAATLLTAFDFPILGIIGGDKLPPGSDVRRSTVGIRRKGSAQTGCTASIIGPRLLLTAGHCLANRDPRDFEVVFGDDLTDRTAPTVGIERGIVHPEFGVRSSMDALCPFFICPVNDDFLRYLERKDFGLIYLSDDIPAGWQAVDLNQSDDGLDVHETITAGFGVRTNRRLVSIDANGLLQSRTSATVFSPEFGKYISVSTPDASSCFGDSGGPMYIRRGDRLIQIGVTSHATTNEKDFACVGRGTAYGSVASVRDWIRESSIEIAKPGPALIWRQSPSLPGAARVSGGTANWLTLRLKNLSLKCSSDADDIGVKMNFTFYAGGLMGTGEGEIVSKRGPRQLTPDKYGDLFIFFRGDQSRAETVWAQTKDAVRTAAAYLHDSPLAASISSSGVDYGPRKELTYLVTSTNGQTVVLKSKSEAGAPSCDLEVTLGGSNP